MSVCLGCVLALSSFASVYGLGRATAWVTGLRRARAMRLVELEHDASADPTEPVPMTSLLAAQPRRDARPSGVAVNA
jgi:hypothetical protein